jgi:hypothetical protein
MEPVAPANTHSSNEAPVSSEKGLESQFENESANTKAVPANGGFLYKTKRHCARFWWVHLIIFCVVFLIIALCL